MILIGWDKKFRLEARYEKQKGVFLSLGWPYVAWLNKDLSFKIAHLSVLDKDTLDNYADMGKIKRDEYYRGHKEGKQQQKEFAEEWKEEYFKENKKASVLNDENIQLKTKLDYFEGIITKNAERV